MAQRQYDLVVHGATGYTGKLICEYIASEFPTEFIWAISGRSRDKLLAVTEAIAVGGRKGPALEVVEQREEQLRSLALKTKCVLSTIGPFCIHGEPLVKVCAESGTHYLDVTGEAAWVKEMITKYQSVAAQSGAIVSLVLTRLIKQLINGVGLDSVPTDVAAFLLAEFVRNEYKSPTKNIIITVHDIKGQPSGGSLATVRALFQKYSLRQLAAASLPDATSPVKPSRAAMSTSLTRSLAGVRFVPDLGTLTTSVQTASDRPIVYRSWGLREQADITVRNAFLGLLAHFLLATVSLLLALPQFRWLVTKVTVSPGSGPSPEDAREHFAEWRGVAIPDYGTGKAFIRVKHNGGAYRLTAITAGEAARALLNTEENLAKKLRGFVTPSTLGRQYAEELKRHGVTFDISRLDS